MRTLFRHLLVILLSTFCILLLAQAVLMRIAVSSSITRWSSEKREEYQQIASTFLQKETEPEQAAIPSDRPFFVFDRNRELLYSNRGKGKALTEKDLIAVKDATDSVIGYYHTSEQHFVDTRANRAFIDSLTRLMVFSFLFSLALVLVASILISKRLSRPIRYIVEGLDRIEKGEDPSLEQEKILELNRIITEIRDLDTSLKREEERRRQWMQDITHDLRTPITALKSQFEGMLDGVLDLTTERITKNLSEIERVERLIEQFSQLMVLEDPDKTIDPEPLEIKRLIDTVLQRFEIQVFQKNIDIRRHLTDIRLLGDNDLLTRALSNLISNAVSYVNEGGSITITTEIENPDTSSHEAFSMKTEENAYREPLTKSDRSMNKAINRYYGGLYLRIRIQNSGNAIPGHELGKLFDRLYRGEYARQSRGSGLGLTIAKRIIELHDGTIEVTSDVEHGTIVWITLPINSS